MEMKKFVTAYTMIFGVTKKSAREMYKANRHNAEYIKRVIARFP